MLYDRIQSGACRALVEAVVLPQHSQPLRSHHAAWSCRPLQGIKLRLCTLQSIMALCGCASCLSRKRGRLAKALRRHVNSALVGNAALTACMPGTQQLREQQRLLQGRVMQCGPWTRMERCEMCRSKCMQRGQMNVLQTLALIGMFKMQGRRDRHVQHAGKKNRHDLDVAVRFPPLSMVVVEYGQKRSPDAGQSLSWFLRVRHMGTCLPGDKPLLPLYTCMRSFGAQSCCAQQGPLACAQSRRGHKVFCLLQYVFVSVAVQRTRGTS